MSEEELVSTLVTFIGENLNSEAATNCLSLLLQLMLKRPVFGAQVGTGLHSLLMATLKPENKFFTINAALEEVKSSAVVSTLD